MTTRRSLPDWEQLYQQEPVEQMPWYYTQLDHDVARTLAEFKWTTGSLLDWGTGPGTQAIALAQRGFKVTATDISSVSAREFQGALETPPKALFAVMETL